MIVSDQSRQVDWYVRKGSDVSLTITVTENNAPFDLDAFEFILEVFKVGSTTPEITLNELDGLTNNGPLGTLEVEILNVNLNSDQYYWTLKTTNDYLWLNGKFIVNDYLFDGDGNDSNTVTLDILTNTLTLTISI